MMRARFAKLNQRYMALSMRERTLVAISILVGICVLWYMLLINPTQAGISASKSRIQSLNKAIKTLEQQHLALLHRQQQDPLRELKLRVTQINLQISATDKKLGEKLHGLVAPQQMARVLETILQQHHELKLLKLESQPAVPLVTEEGKNAKDQKQDQKQESHRGSEIYRHGLQLEFEGTYLATLAYLKALQNLPLNFYWDAVRLQVEKYPRSKVTIVVHTLSLTEGWIGV